MADFKVQLGVQLDKNASTQIKNQLKGISAEVNSAKLSSNAINEIKAQLNSAKFNINIDTAGANKQVNNLVANINKMNKLAVGMHNLGKMNIDDSGLKNQLSTIKKEFEAIKKMSDSGLQATSLAELDGKLKILTADAKAYNKAIANKNNANFVHEQSKAIQTHKTYINENTKAAKKYSTQLEEVRKKLVEASNVKELSTAKKQFAALKAEIKATGNSGRSFGDEMKNSMSKFGQWISAGTIVMQGIRGIRDGFNEIVALDDAMIELKKVTEATSEAYSNFYFQSNNIAKSLGQTTSAVISTTASFAQLGYTMTDAIKLTEIASKLSTISPEMNVEQATSVLIASMKAYHLEADDALDGIASKINYVGNNFAVTNTDIAEFLQRSASSLATANTSIDQSIALGQAITEVTRDASNAGQVLKTYAARLAGIDEETGLVDDSLQTLKSDLKDLTGVNVYNLDGSMRSVYDITKDIHDVWAELTDKQRSATIELVSGKRNANSINALISNFSSAEKALDGLKDSAGSADAEFEKAQQGISFKLNALKETGVGIFQNILDSDAIKTGVDLLTSLLGVIQDLTGALGGLGTIGAIGGGILGAKGLGWANVYVNINSCRHNLCPDKA